MKFKSIILGLVICGACYCSAAVEQNFTAFDDLIHHFLTLTLLFFIGTAEKEDHDHDQCYRYDHAFP